MAVVPPLGAQIQRVQDDLQKRQAAYDRAQKDRVQQEAEHAKSVDSIERLRAEPPGTMRDYRLDGRLAQAKEQADRLSALSEKLRQQNEALLDRKRQLLALCDQALAQDGKTLSGGVRVQWLRLSVSLVEQLYADVPDRVRSLALSSALLERKDQPLDDPQKLSEQADLLRDFADKLLRETAKLTQRRLALLSRQRVRERAAAVDEDLFAEQVTARRGSGAQTGRESLKAADATAPGAALPATPQAPPSTDSSRTASSGVGRTGLDPATLDALLRADSGGDGAAQAAAWQHAETELQNRAALLQNKAAQLEKQAQALRSAK